MQIWDDLFTVGDLPKLAPDLAFPTDAQLGNSDPQQPLIIGINAVGSLTPALSLIGKFKIQFIQFGGLATENMTFKLTVDGEDVWNGVRAVAVPTLSFIGHNSAFDEYQCDETFLLEVMTTVDADIQLAWQARPIL